MQAPVETHGVYNKLGAAVKADKGKLQWHLWPMQYFHGAVQVMMKGAAKYAPHNWRRGMPWSQPYNALQRHLDAFLSGQDLDPETGEHHLDHAMCCLMFLRCYTLEFPEHDDRYRKDDVDGSNT